MVQSMYAPEGEVNQETLVSSSLILFVSIPYMCLGGSRPWRSFLTPPLENFQIVDFLLNNITAEKRPGFLNTFFFFSIIIFNYVMNGNQVKLNQAYILMCKWRKLRGLFNFLKIY